MSELSQVTYANSVRIEFGEKNLKAYLTLREQNLQENPDIPPLNSDDLMAMILKAGVIFGINEEVVRSIIDSQKIGEKILIAEGTPPIPGTDAILEYYFPTDKSLKPHVSDDGHVDFKDISVVFSVTKDALLIREIPATNGTPGKNVQGNEVPPLTGKLAKISLGPGAVRDPKDNSLIKAAVDGIIFYDPINSRIEVQQLYKINGSVDYSTGNINVTSSVEIHGDVKPEFSITTPYNVQIDGMVEHATISCGGALTVKGGIKGDGKQLITVGKDIHSAYINDQHIKSTGSIFANSEIRNAFIECNGEVNVLQNFGVILGGKIIAANKVSAASIGNKYSIPTEIEIGIHYHLKEQLVAKEVEMNELSKKVDEFQRNITSLEQQFSDSVNTAALKKLYSDWKKLSDQLEVVNKEYVELERAYYDVENPIVAVSKMVYPGVIIKIKKARLEIKDDLPNVIFKLSGNEIIYTSGG